jgi:hypothetical protein
MMRRRNMEKTAATAAEANRILSILHYSNSVIDWAARRCSVVVCSISSLVRQMNLYSITFLRTPKLLWLFRNAAQNGW